MENLKKSEFGDESLLSKFQIEELDDRLEMCWFNCNTNDCIIQSNTTNESCCSPSQTNGSQGVTIRVGGGGESPTGAPNPEP